MADNVTADPGTGGATFATDDDGTAHWPYAKVAWGADNTQTRVAAGAAALPIQDGGNAITVDGTVTAELSAVDNAVLDAIQAAVETIDNAISGNEMQVDVVSAPRGTSHYRNIDANAESEIKGSAGTLYWLHAINLTAAIAYLHLYDATAANVTPGTTTPNFTFPIPTQGDTNGAGFVLPLGSGGQAFANGITLVVTTTTDGSTGDPGTNGVMVNAGYT